MTASQSTTYRCPRGGETYTQEEARAMDYFCSTHNIFLLAQTTMPEVVLADRIAPPAVSEEKLRPSLLNSIRRDSATNRRPAR